MTDNETPEKKYDSAISTLQRLIEENRGRQSRSNSADPGGGETVTLDALPESERERLERLVEERVMQRLKMSSGEGGDATPEKVAPVSNGGGDAAERLEAERIEAERLEAERIEAERKEAERLEAERKEAERIEAERKEAERLEAERKEAERLEAERKEAERKEAERLEAERIEAERKEAERIEAERKEAERIEAERKEAERIEAERKEAERIEAERKEAERKEAERLEAERIEAERIEAERKEAQRKEAERIEAERKEAERLEAERKEAERIEAERIEAERKEAERKEAERIEAERKEAERIEAERKEAERIEAERKEAERMEAERLEAERKEAERIEAERKEAERLEAERKEAERKEAERMEAERKEAERKEAERIEAVRVSTEGLEAELKLAEAREASLQAAERLQSSQRDGEIRSDDPAADPDDVNVSVSASGGANDEIGGGSTSTGPPPLVSDSDPSSASREEAEEALRALIEKETEARLTKRLAEIKAAAAAAKSDPSSSDGDPPGTPVGFNDDAFDAGLAQMLGSGEHNDNNDNDAIINGNASGKPDAPNAGATTDAQNAPPVAADIPTQFVEGKETAGASSSSSSASPSRTSNAPLPPASERVSLELLARARQRADSLLHEAEARARKGRELEEKGLGEALREIGRARGSSLAVAKNEPNAAPSSSVAGEDDDNADDNGNDAENAASGVLVEELRLLEAKRASIEDLQHQLEIEKLRLLRERVTTAQRDTIEQQIAEQESEARELDNLIASKRKLAELPSLASEWSVQDVSTFLASLGYDGYVPAFARLGVDGELLMELDENEMEHECGVDSGVARKKIAMEIDKLRDRERDAHATSMRMRKRRRKRRHGGDTSAATAASTGEDLGTNGNNSSNNPSYDEYSYEYEYEEEDPATWTVTRVQQWLRDLSLRAHAKAFAEHSVDGAALLHLSDADLERDLKIESSVVRRRLHAAVRELRNSSTRYRDSPTTPVKHGNGNGNGGPVRMSTPLSARSALKGSAARDGYVSEGKEVQFSFDDRRRRDSDADSSTSLTSHSSGVDDDDDMSSLGSSVDLAEPTVPANKQPGARVGPMVPVLNMGKVAEKSAAEGNAFDGDGGSGAEGSSPGPPPQLSARTPRGRARLARMQAGGGGGDGDDDDDGIDTGDETGGVDVVQASLDDSDLYHSANDMTGPLADDPCAECGAFPADYMCGACTSVSYCSAECQRDGWPKHHAECADLIRKTNLRKFLAARTIQKVFRGHSTRARLRREREESRAARRRSAMVEKLNRGARPNQPETLDWVLLAEEHTARKHIRRSLTTVLSGDAPAPAPVSMISGAVRPRPNVIRTVYREWRRVTPVPVTDAVPATARDPSTRRGPIGQLRRLADLYFDGFASDAGSVGSGTEFEFSLVVSLGMYAHLSTDELRCLVRLLRNLTEAHSDLLVRLLAEREELRETESVYTATIENVTRSAAPATTLGPLVIASPHHGSPAVGTPGSAASSGGQGRSRAGSIKSWIMKKGTRLRSGSTQAQREKEMQMQVQQRQAELRASMARQQL